MTQAATAFRKLPAWLAFVIAAIASFVIALVAGFLGANIAMYVYDHGMSKGDDFAVGMGGLFAVGTFVFIVAFTWLVRFHHAVSARTPVFAWLFCLVLAVATTAGMYDYEYSQFILADWALILTCGLGGLALCRRKLIAAPVATPPSSGAGNRAAR